ncbi:MAG: nuclear transport factor 2 family protein [Acidobacteriaceae bacterium]|nr:nuclear transport factor 2 family protein [Acidobacteriaceae bacterium]
MNGRYAVALGLVLFASAARIPAQMLAPQTAMPDPLTTPTLTPGQQTLYKLEADFAADVARSGGSAFARWFAEDGVILPNAKAAIMGLHAVSGYAQWDPKQYQLSWTPDGAQMDPGGDSGFTWGHYAGKTHDQQGSPVTVEGRYITVWKKTAGAWKVALDASAEDAPATDCCSLPKP